MEQFAGYYANLHKQTIRRLFDWQMSTRANDQTAYIYKPRGFNWSTDRRRARITTKSGPAFACMCGDRNSELGAQCRAHGESDLCV